MQQWWQRGKEPWTAPYHSGPEPENIALALDAVCLGDAELGSAWPRPGLRRLWKQWNSGPLQKVWFANLPELSS